MGIWADIAENFLTADTVCFVINAATLGILQRVYNSKYNNYEAVKTARQLEISERLSTTLLDDYPNGTCAHAVIRGAIKATGTPLRSRLAQGQQGVVQRVMVIEHKMKWNPISRFWTHQERVIQDRMDCTQFVLTSLSTKNSRASVEVPNPMESACLPLKVVHDEFTPSKEGFGRSFFGWLEGEQPQGIQEQEYLLQEGTIVTGFGTLVTDGTGSVALVAPKDAQLMLTTETHAKLTEQLSRECRWVRYGCIFFGITCTALASYMAYRIYNNYRRRKQHRTDSMRRDELRRNRRREARNAHGVDSLSGTPQCVVCLTNTVEVLLLECGHLCLCTDCCDQLSDNLCPICRSMIIRQVAAYLP
ncbi:mitochondrial ubiquitin ligase activator of nfkb 1-like [Tropilaelaps mercedesae]|uniref:RING-type E3 ubiquitin transferase n=1 Tax=Tropilaelaps mercedesae TaxID=418985 RepID=A0A1V9XV99_9ACAR|nr:mitochondrial ubiquitin ligase activator of nfkb 1-like [Tropilaelaps mercedesae]